METETLNLLQEISKRLEKIENHLEKIEDRLEKIEASTSNMDEHIGFVETVYQQVQVPFHSLIEFTRGSFPMISN